MKHIQNCHFLWSMLFDSSLCLQQGEDFWFFDFLSEFYSLEFCDEACDPMREILLCSLYKKNCQGQEKQFVKYNGSLWKQ